VQKSGNEEEIREFGKLKTDQWDGGIVQVVEHLPSNHRTLSSNPSLKKNKK
jgi:hypothetical protein